MQEQNPWWIGDEDHTYERWKHYRVKWVPGVVEDITFKPFSLHFLVGPRQVGKTTALKICIHNLLKERNPKSVFYYSCDELTDHRELGELLDNYLAARKEWGIGESVLFLDEVTFVEDWWRAIKARIDAGAFQRDILVVTGSASIELLGEKERFPGRRGNGKDLYLLPLDFADYAQKLGGLETKRAPARDLQAVERCAKANSVYGTKLSELFSAYLKTGGFPMPVREHFEEGRISPESWRTYLDWLRSDWKRAGKSDGYMKGALNYILKARLSPVSWLGIAKETSIGSPHTAQSYVECLEDLLAVKTLNLITPESKVMFRKNKKIHIIDPFLYQTFSNYTGVNVLEETLAESVVASHLGRAFETYFWKDGSEVDAISIVGREQVGFEVKWGPKGWRKPKHLKRAFTLSKENLPLFLSSAVWDKRD